MIQITFSFPDAAAAAAMLAQLNGQQLGAITFPPIELPTEAPGKPSAAPTARSKRTAEAAPSTPAPSPAAPAPTAESSDAQPTAAPAAAPSAPSPVTYPDLQKAVLQLHKMDPTAAVPIAKSLGADTFKALKPEQWAEAHRLVTEAIAARG